MRQPYIDNEVKLQNSVYNDWHVLSVIGRIDVTTSASVEEAGAATLDAAEKIAMDMSKTDYISSAGLRVLLRLSKKAKRAKKTFVLFGASGIIQDVFAASGMDMLVTIYKSKDDLP